MESTRILEKFHKNLRLDFSVDSNTTACFRIFFVTTRVVILAEKA